MVLAVTMLLSLNLPVSAENIPNENESVILESSENEVETDAQVKAESEDAAKESESKEVVEKSKKTESKETQTEEETVKIVEEAETKVVSESESETETESELIRYIVSGIYSGQGRMTLTDNLGNVYSIPEPGEVKTFEYDEQSQVILKVSPNEGYEIDAVEIEQQEDVESITDKEILNASKIYEKSITVTADTNIKVAFAELPEESESEPASETDAVMETETTIGPESKTESETELESESKAKAENEIESETNESRDGKLTKDEREEALKMSKEMDAAIKTNEAIMTLSLGEVGQSWAMFEVFVNRIVIAELGPTAVTHFSHIIQTGPTYSEYTRTAYCVQYGVSIPAGSYATESLLPQLQQNYMGYALAYGWKQNGTAYDESQYESNTARAEYAVTQAIVWACSQGKFNTDVGEAAINQIIQNTHDPNHALSYYQQLKAAILNAETVPSFSGSDSGAAPTIKLEWNSGNSRFEATVADANGVLDRYNYSYDGINFEKDGNNLTIWTTNTYADGITASAVYTTTGGSNAVVTWDGENGTQDLAAYADIPNNIYSYIRIETENLGSLELIKTSANPDITNNSSCYSLAGAVYGVYNAANQEIGRITTDVNGWGQLTDIPTGNYTVKEITAPKGFYVDMKSHNVTIVPGQKATVNVKDAPKMDPVGIVLGKIDAETNSNKPSGSKSLEGALFEVKFYSVRMDVDPAASGYKPDRKWVLRTDDDGFAYYNEDSKVSGDEFYYGLTGNPSLPSGTITIEEIQAPEGYLINNEVFVRQIIPGNTQGVSTYNNPEVVETPQVIQIELYKVDSETNKAEAQGTGSLAGAEYNVVDADNKVVDTLVTDEKGYAISKELPLGVYKVKETASSNGYLVDAVAHTVDGSEAQDTTTRVFKYKVTSGEDVIRGDVEIIKIYENIDEDNDTLQGIEGVEFTITSKTTGKVVKKIVTDKIGFATTASADQPRGSLVFDTYIVTETKWPEGVKPIEPFEVTISQEGVVHKGIYKEDKLIVSPVTVVKKDKSTGKIIPAANTEFRLLDAAKNPITMTSHYPAEIVYETFKTDDKGQFTFPDKLKYGTYYLEEVNAPDEYLKGELLEFKVTEGASWENPLVIEFFDEAVMGKIRVEKTDIESGNPIDGAEFDVIASEDIITPDGTVRLHKGDVADHLVTKDGAAESKKLYLGNYELHETKQPQGFILSDEVYPVKLEYKDQVTPVVLTTIEVDNMPVKVRIIKVDSESGEPLPGVEFKIWNKAMAEGDIDADMAVNELCITDKNGVIELGYLAPGTYCVQETKSVYGYALDDTIHEFVVSEDGRIDGKEIGEITIKNTPVEIGTKATDKVDGDQIITNTGKETIVDTVAYKGLIPGKEYTVSGVLMVKSTGKPLLDNGKEVTAELTFVPDAADGEVKLEFTFNAKALAGEKLVAFESVQQEKLEIAVHEDIEDKDQTVEVVPIKIGTKAIDKTDGDQIIPNMPDVTIVDTVSYTHLVPGREYTVSGVLMEKSTGKPLLADGKEVTAQKEFIPEAADGEVDVEFVFDASALAGQELVVFEELYYDSEIIAEHKDIDDKGQTIEIVEIKIGTKAADKEDGDQVVPADEDMTIVDTVSYTHLIPGREYTVSGVLMDKATGKPLLDNGKEVTAELTFVPDAEEGEVKLEFTFDASALAGQTIVVFETLLYNGREIAAHEDIEDKDQSIDIVPPKIKTTAVNKADGSKEITAKGTVTILDTVSYTDLVPGRKYTVSGILMDKATGKAFLVDGKEITAQAEFTPDKASGTVTVEFVFDATGLKDMDLVVFEKLLNANGKVIASHEDINDEGQTVHLKKSTGTITSRHDNPGNSFGTPVRTGDVANTNMMLMIAIVSIAAMAWISIKKRKGDKVE